MHYAKPILPEDDAPRDRAALMRAYKAFLKVEEARILLRHRQTKEGLRICQERTDLIDHVVRCLWHDMPRLPHSPLKTKPVPVALVATGGYARGVMNRHSDIDLSFFIAGNKFNPKPDVETFIGDYHLFLSDLGFVVGHATDCVGGRLAQANNDNLTKTSLITTRFIGGDRAPYDEFQERFVAACIEGQEDKFLLRQLKELTDRHGKHEDTPFVQQPNVKEGCGGLRDFQNLVWCSFAKLRITDLSKLVEKDMLDRRGWNEMRRAYDFLLRVRNELHYLERREQDVLSMKLQGTVATRLGYKGERMIQRIEDFMHDYYIHVRNLLRQSSKLMDRYNLLYLNQGEDRSLVRKLFSKVSPGTKKTKVEHFDGFNAKHGRIFADDDRDFRTEPARMMRLFMHTQQRNLRLAPDLYDFVCNTALVNAEFRYSKAVREVFLGILEHKGSVARVLRQMHRADFLGKYLPEFGALTCRVQHEFFHTYTGDEHTLRCIDYLDELAGAEQKGIEFYQHLFRQNHDPAILYLALLMHDTGRAANKKTHADESTMLTDKLARRMQIKGERRNQLIFLVNNHLLMFFTATKQNPDDPEVVKTFANIVRTRENLDALTVMTYADSKGVGGTGWNGFKDAALKELYLNTMRFLDAPADFMARATVPLDDLKARVMGELSKGYAEEVSAHFERMPRAYFNFRKPSTIANHLKQFRAVYEQVANNSNDMALMPVLRWEDKPAEGCSKLMVVGWDRHLLLARVAGALAAENLSIVSADFYQRADQLVLDVFRVSTINFEPVTGESTRKRVEKAVHEALRADQFDFSPRIYAKRKLTAPPDIAADIPQWVFINNRISEKQTVVELHAHDRIGLLYDVFMVIGKLGYSVSNARISTERGMAVDAIYIQDISGKKIEDKERTMAIKSALEASVITSV